MRINAIGASLLFGKGRNAIYVTPLSLQLMQFQNFQKYLSCKILDITYLQKVAFPELITSYFPRPGPIYCIKYSLYDLQERENGKKPQLWQLNTRPSFWRRCLSSAALESSIFLLFLFFSLGRASLVSYYPLSKPFLNLHLNSSR